MTSTIGIRRPIGVPWGDVAPFCWAVRARFAAVADGAVAVSAADVAVTAAAFAERGTRAAGDAVPVALAREGRLAGSFCGVARLLLFLLALITLKLSGAAPRRESQADLPGNAPNKIANVPDGSAMRKCRWTLVERKSASVWSCP